MKPIELTEEHKSKLIEMCKVLFPEMGNVQLGVKEKHGWSNDYLVFGIEKSDEDTFVIHWFEFCMTHLRVKLNLHHDDLYLTTNPGRDTFNHPVDHLYKAFKNHDRFEIIN